MLSDTEACERLGVALIALGNEAAANPTANTALIAARLALTAYQMALLASIEQQPKIQPPPY